jgi:hypothetical protein
MELILIQKLENALRERERSVKSELLYDVTDKTLNIAALRRLLRNDSTNVQTPSPAHFTAFVQQLCVYRLFDVANRLAGKPQSLALHGKQRFIIRRGFVGLSQPLTEQVLILV